MVYLFPGRNQNKNVGRAYDEKHTTRASEKKRKQGVNRKVGRFFLDSKQRWTVIMRINN